MVYQNQLPCIGRQEAEEKEEEEKMVEEKEKVEEEEEEKEEEDIRNPAVCKFPNRRHLPFHMSGRQGLRSKRCHLPHRPPGM